MTWQPIETAPLNWVPVLVWAISEGEFEEAKDDGREPEYSAMVAVHSDIQPGHWWLQDTCYAVHRPKLWQPITPPEAQS